MAAVELFLSSFLGTLFDKLAGELSIHACEDGMDIKRKKWKKTLSVVQALLPDAEEKQLTDINVKMWLEDLKDLAYDLEDILDEIATQALQSRSPEEPQAQTKAFWNFVCNFGKSSNPPAIRFSVNMRSKLNEISTRLREISERTDRLGLVGKTGEISKHVCLQFPSTSLLSEPEIYGRDEDKTIILHLLFKDETSDANFRVVPIVGLGGVGKTTLARMVYNDEAFANFDMKAWVCVTDEFDPMRITKVILESVTSEPCNLTEFSQVQVKLQETLAGKRFLVVLDDVWNRNYGAWDVLRSPFRAGAPGSKILVTTRNTDVALMIGSGGYHQLKELSDDDCWCVFKGHAFENRNIEEHPKLESIGKKIVKRCGGLPLAARSSKQKEKEWEHILNSEIWTLSDGQSDILPVLRLSYYHLPLPLKRRFGYCAIFPRGYEFEEEELIWLWIAEGLINGTKDYSQLEELGRTYLHELLSRSFFQQLSKDKSCFVMHDLIKNLAQWVSGDTCFRMEDELDSTRRISERLRHVSYIGSQYDGPNRFKGFYNAKCLRTFLPLMLPGTCYLTRSVLLDLLPELRCLRVLSLRGYHVTDLPSSVGNLKHLRYLDLSMTMIQVLPESISALYNLEFLRLEKCSRLKKLPAEVRNLVNLHHLINSHADALKGMPRHIGNLTNLQTLSTFVVGSGNCSSLSELGPLLHLGGELYISGLENVSEANDAKRANIIGKRDIDSLVLHWRSQSANKGRETSEVVLDMLQPHRTLRELTIMGYGGTKFPSWVGNRLYSSMVSLLLKYCKCTCLPPLGILPSLKNLVIFGMSALKQVDLMFFGNGISKPFPSLETLYFGDMKEWGEWICHEVQAFHRLRLLSICKCPKLAGNLPTHLPSLETLEIDQCEEFVASIPMIPKLFELKITRCKEVDFSSSIDFGSLQTMVLSAIPEFTDFVEGFIHGLNEVEELIIANYENCWQFKKQLGCASLRRSEIENCTQLVSLVEDYCEKQSQRGLACKLKCLTVKNHKSIEKLPQWLHDLRCLEKLRIENCARLVPFPEDSFFSMLKEIYIYGCNSLTSFGRNLLPSSLRRLEIRGCWKLQSLLDVPECSFSSSSMIGNKSLDHCSLEILSVGACQSLSSISLPASVKQLEVDYCDRLRHLFYGSAPNGLKSLVIDSCSSLSTIADNVEDNSSLEQIRIASCANLNSLPAGTHNFSHLCQITFFQCPFFSFPEDWLPSANLRVLTINHCMKLKALPNGLHKLLSLEELFISHCPGVDSFPAEGFPINLIELIMCSSKICKPLFEWGLHRLTSLRHLHIDGGCKDVVSFPLKEIGMMLPRSLISLSIGDLPNLKSLSAEGFQNLSSLDYLHICDCPRLEYLPLQALPPHFCTCISTVAPA